jgi:CheY-like chemotaxis protein
MTWEGSRWGKYVNGIKAMENEKKKIKVLIVDDHTIVRDGLRALLSAQPDIEVVSEAVNGDEAIAKSRQFHPDLVLMDITMPGMNGLDATRQIKQMYPDIKVLALTMHESDEYFFNADAELPVTSSQALPVSLIGPYGRNDMYLSSMAKKLLTDYCSVKGPGPIGMCTMINLNWKYSTGGRRTLTRKSPTLSYSVLLRYRLIELILCPS